MPVKEIESDTRVFGTLQIVDRTGDTRVSWNRSAVAEVENAQKMFDDLTKKGYLAYTIDPVDGGKAEQIKKFDPNAERIVLTPPLAGG